MAVPSGSILLAETLHRHRDGTLSILGANVGEIEPGEQVLTIVAAMQVAWAEPDSPGREVDIELALWAADEYGIDDAEPLQTVRARGTVPPPPETPPRFPHSGALTDAGMMAKLLPTREYVVVLSVEGQVADYYTFRTLPEPAQSR